MAMLPDLIRLQQAALRHKYESLKVELSTWKELSEKDKVLEKHHRQVRRLDQELGGMLTRVETEVNQLGAVTDPNRFLQQMRRAEYLILEVHRTWQFFRDKLVARQGPPFANLLEALDEFVWSCYHPAFEKPPEPPLVFFSGEWSPLAFARRASLPVMATADANATRYNQLDQVRLRQMVIPTVSLPWYTTTFLPMTLLLAHEAAHLIDFDLNLANGLAQKLRETGIDQERLEKQWLPWQAEVFADLYGVLTLGPAFVSTLMLLLSGTKNEVLRGADPQNNYPPHHLRFLIALAALHHLGFAEQADELTAIWLALYGQVTDYVHADCVKDIKYVITVMLETPLAALPGGQSFSSLKAVKWDNERQKSAEKVRERLLSPHNLPLQATNPRIVLAGAQLAFQQKPEQLVSAGLAVGQSTPKIIEEILKGREPGVRNRNKVLKELPPADSYREQDIAAGKRVVEILLAEIGKVLPEDSGLIPTADSVQVILL